MPLSDYKIGVQNTSLLICQISQIHTCVGGVTDGISASRLGKIKHTCTYIFLSKV